MTTTLSDDLLFHLESQYKYQIIGSVDLDWLVTQPRNTLFKLFRKWHKAVYEPHDRIVLYSRHTPSQEILTYIQQCGSQVDISNFFILICSPKINIKDLDHVRINYSTDESIFSTVDINFSDQIPMPDVNPFLRLPDNFCFAPWAHLEISSLGEFKPCCVYKESVKKSDGIPYNINVDTISEIYNSKYLQNLRQEFLNGNQPVNCSHCWLIERHNGTSYRQRIPAYLGLEAQCLQIEHDSIGNLISLDIKLGNLCNFKCRICAPVNSSRIAEERLAHFNSSIDLKTLNKNGRWVENQNIWKMLETLGDQLINIDFYGGEPFLIKQHDTFLDFLILKQQTHKIRLHYNSNGSVYPKHLLDKWRQFRKIDIAFSIDNIGKKFELERGGDWNMVENNLDNFLKSKLSNMTLSIFPTVNIQNVYYIDQIIEWFETKSFDTLIFNLLEQPSFLSIMAMTQPLSELVLDKLNQIPQDKLIKYSIDSIIKLIKQHQSSSNTIDQLANYMLKLDDIRKQKFNESHPEITNIIYKGK